MQVTDYKWEKTLKNGTVEHRVGYYMDEFLATNLMGIPQYLKKSWDTVGIISGHGKVRIGKALRKDSKVLMANGTWKNVQNIKVNDKVISPSSDGKETIIAPVTETIAHDNLEMCEIRNSRDGSLLYTCCVEHQIPVRTLWIKTDKTASKKPTEYIWKDEVYEAGELLNKNERWFKNHCPKIITSPIITKFDVEDYNINPYFLGLYLGDGWIASKNRVKISNPSLEIFKWLNTNFKIISKKGITININYDSKKIIECGKGSYNKKLPKKVLSSSYEYRKKVLEGLLDTDAYINKSGYVIYTTASEKLAKGVHDLCKTLGCRVNIKLIYKNCQTFKEKRKYYNIYINLGELSKDIKIFRKRKERLLKINLNDIKNKDSQFESIIINKISKKQKGYCLQVDSKSHLYIIDNYCVTHNSTMAQQIGYFLAWLLAGGKMNRDLQTNKWYVSSPVKKEIRFNLKENLVFSPQELMDKAASLYKKYGKNQVIIYDEGRAGLDSARAMQAINKIMQDFFQECGQYGHVILIVLPNFFKLHEDYAVARSLFLVDVYADKNLNRGFFDFYNERKKEWLFFNGKKKIGTSLKYIGTYPNFHGRFTKFLPLDEKEYNQAKKEALQKKQLLKTERKWKKQRDALIYIHKRETETTYDELAKEMSVICGFPISAKMMEHGYANITHEKPEED